MTTKEKCLDLYGKLIDVPELDSMIYHYLLELREKFRDRVENYGEMISFLKKEAYGEMQVCEEETVSGGKYKNRPHGSYHFVLARNTRGKFIVESLEPNPPPGQDSADILPPSAISIIRQSTGASQGLISRVKLSLPELGGGKFDLRFSFLSPDKIAGTIKKSNRRRQNKSRTNTGTAPEPPAPPTPPGDAPPRENPGNNRVYKSDKCMELQSGEFDYKELYRYMEANPELKQEIFKKFYMVYKPVIDASVNESAKHASGRKN